MDIQQTITDLENYALSVQDLKAAATGLLAGLDGFFDELQQGETFTQNDLLALWEQYKLTSCQEALTKELSNI